MNLWQSLLGTIEIQAVSADPAEYISALVNSGVQILETKAQNQLTVRIHLHRSDLNKARILAEKKGISIQLVQRHGLYWVMKGLLGRPVLVTGIAFLIILSLYLPTRILFVEVEGNRVVPTRLILEQASARGIRFGASRREVRSEKMKNALLGAMPELQWAGVNTRGCTAIIIVREREIVEQPLPQSGISSLVASRDGVISSLTVTKGSAVCAVGQAVKAGQVLISGYTDCGLLIRGDKAEGEVFADTHRTLAAVTPLCWQEKGETQSTRKKYSLKIGKILINFEKDSGIQGSLCDRIYEEKYVTVPGGFRLPAALIVETMICREPVPIEVSQQEAQQTLTDFTNRYLKQQMVAGQIQVSATAFGMAEGVCRMDGQFACREMIGQVQKEEIVTPNGNTN